MRGKFIRLEDRELTYFSAGEQLMASDRQAIGYDISDDVAFLAHPRVRRVLGTLIRPVPKLFQMLHWSDGSDLHVLDSAIRSGRVDERDFDGALLVEARTVSCSVCSAQVRVLAVDTGQVLFHGTLSGRLRNHVLVSVCPRCHHPWTVQAVELIE